ncbi:MAG: polysaccharide pyruvyl transferase family protein [Bacteroidaceae bacterium]|nr:polysaccharide pyruvyl transferase family protein [Bacteroidaceae bacterium]
METTANNICTQLGDLIKTTLAPSVKGDYIYLDLPYHSNIGDILIWLGTEEFLKNLPGKCLGRHSKETFNFRPLPKDVTIFLHGGGNFGDIWRQHQEFRLQVIQRYPENHIIVLPQTIHYDSDVVFAQDVKTMNMHRHLTICVRDTHSAELLKEQNFTGYLLTLPDMAFCINTKELMADMTETSQKSLLLLRDDKEMKEPQLANKYLSYSLSDWPQMQESGVLASQFILTHKKEEADTFFIHKFFPKLIKEGVEFASSYKDICSTRLHVVILRLLLGLPVKMIDNSYGKNLNFYNTWLKDSELTSIPNEEELKAIYMTFFLHKKEEAQKKEYETEKEKELHEIENHYLGIIHIQEEKIQQLQQEADWESSKHKKYKKLFNVAAIAISVLVFLLLLTLILQ